MGAYAPRDPKRLKKMDQSHREAIIKGDVEDPMPGTSGEPPYKKRNTSYPESSNDFVIQTNQKKELIDQIMELYGNELKNLSLEILIHKLNKRKRLNSHTPPQRI